MHAYVRAFTRGLSYSGCGSSLSSAPQIGGSFVFAFFAIDFALCCVCQFGGTTCGPTVQWDFSRVNIAPHLSLTHATPTRAPTRPGPARTESACMRGVGTRVRSATHRLGAWRRQEWEVVAGTQAHGLWLPQLKDVLHRLAPFLTPAGSAFCRIARSRCAVPNWRWVRLHRSWPSACVSSVTRTRMLLIRVGGRMDASHDGG
jgi:hypothetical protein